MRQLGLVAKIKHPAHLPGINAHEGAQALLRHGLDTHGINDGQLDCRTRGQCYHLLAALGFAGFGQRGLPCLFLWSLARLRT